LAAGGFTTRLQTKRLSGAQWKKLIKAKKTKEGTWTVEKPTGKTPSQDMAFLMVIRPADFAGQRLKLRTILFVLARRWLVNVISSLGNCLLNQSIKAWPY
jgi:hypothetical protein